MKHHKIKANISHRKQQSKASSTFHLIHRGLLRNKRRRSRLRLPPLILNTQPSAQATPQTPCKRCKGRRSLPIIQILFVLTNTSHDFTAVLRGTGSVGRFGAVSVERGLAAVGARGRRIKSPRVRGDVRVNVVGAFAATAARAEVVLFLFGVGCVR